jgi:hypothetical protein
MWASQRHKRFIIQTTKTRRDLCATAPKLIVAVLGELMFTLTMHNYPTRFASSNRSFFPVEDDNDGDYTVNLDNWDPSTARRPVTRSMTRVSASAAVLPTASRNTSRSSNSSDTLRSTHSMTLRSSRR